MCIRLIFPAQAMCFDICSQAISILCYCFQCGNVVQVYLQALAHNIHSGQTYQIEVQPILLPLFTETPAICRLSFSIHFKVGTT